MEISKSSSKVLFEPFEKQIQLLEAVFSNNYNLVMFGGAIRGGKTFAGLGTLLLLCKKYPNSKWVVVRNSLITIKRNTKPSFYKICPENFLKSFNEELQTATFTNGIQILFMGENYDEDKDLNRFKGLECNGFLLEEMNELQQKTFYKCIERAGSHIITNSPKPIILATCNPTNNWVKELVYDKWKNETLPNNWLYIPSKISDNPFIPADYLESLKSMPKYEYEVFVNGNWDIQLKTGGEFYKYFDINKHIVDYEYDPKLPLHISFDENVNPYMPCGVFQIVGKQLRMIDEICLKSPRNTLKDLCSDIVTKYNSHASGMFIYGDSTSQKEDVKQEKGYNLFTLIRQYLQQFKPIMRIPKGNPSVVMRGNFINNVLDNNFEGIEVCISSKCKIAIEDFTCLKQGSDGGKHKEKETNAETKVSYQKYGHMTDLFDYIICYAFANEYAIYQRGNGSIVRSFAPQKTERF